MREGIPALFVHGGVSGPYVARLLSDTSDAFSADRLSQLLGVAPLRIILAFGVTSPSITVSRREAVSYCRNHPGEVWRWQQAYRSNARPPVHAVPAEVSDA